MAKRPHLVSGATACIGSLFFAQYARAIGIKFTKELSEPGNTLETGQPLWEIFEVLSRTWEMSGAGYLEKTSLAPQSPLFSKVRGDIEPVIASMGSAAVGDVALLGQTGVFGYELFGETAKLCPWGLEARGDEVLQDGKILENDTYTSTLDTSAPVQLGAIGEDELLTAVACLDADAFSCTGVTLKLQSDDAQAFSDPTDRLTFDALTAAGGSLKTLAGPVADTWWRVAVQSLTGVEPSVKLLCAAGIR